LLVSFNRDIFFGATSQNVKGHPQGCPFSFSLRIGDDGLGKCGSIFKVLRLIYLRLAPTPAQNQSSEFSSRNHNQTKSKTLRRMILPSPVHWDERGSCFFTKQGFIGKRPPLAFGAVLRYNDPINTVR